MNKTFLLTVIIPTYNRAPELKKTLKSFTKNKNPKICFLILNNNSTDNTIEVVQNYKKKDNRIKLINNKKNLGVASSLKLGLEKFKTPFCTIVSDQYILVGNYFEWVIKIFINYKKVNIIHHDNNTNNSQRYYQIYKEGLESATKAFNFASFISGLSFRKSNLSLSNYPKNPNAIYIQLFPIINLTKKGKFAQIFNCKFKHIKKIPKPKTKKLELRMMKEISIRQSRPADWGLFEMVNYIHQSNYNTFEKMVILQKKLIWICSITKKLPYINYIYTLKKMEKVFGNYFIFYYIYLIIYRFDIYVFKIFLKKIVSLKYYKNHIIALLIFFTYIYRKVIRA